MKIIIHQETAFPRIINNKIQILMKIRISSFYRSEISLIIISKALSSWRWNMNIIIYGPVGKGSGTPSRCRHVGAKEIH